MTKLDDVLQQLTQHHDNHTPSSLSLPLPSKPTTHPIPKPTPPARYPIKRLTYSEMQQLRDQELCLNCNDIDNPSHRCPIKRILLVLPDEVPHIEQQPLELLEPADLKASQFQSVALNSSVAIQMDMGITQHSLYTKMAHILDLPIDKSFSLSIAARNGKNIMSKGLCSKNYVLFLRSWVECTIKMDESKVFIFDPGGISRVKQHIWSLTLRTRSFSERVVMIRCGQVMIHHQLPQQGLTILNEIKAADNSGSKKH